MSGSENSFSAIYLNAETADHWHMFNFQEALMRSSTLSVKRADQGGSAHKLGNANKLNPASIPNASLETAARMVTVPESQALVRQITRRMSGQQHGPSTRLIRPDEHPREDGLQAGKARIVQLETRANSPQPTASIRIG
jgi:hypothetical protein